MQRKDKTQAISSSGQIVKNLPPLNPTLSKEAEKYNAEANAALHNAKGLGFGALPVITYFGLQMLFDKNKGRFDLSALGLPIAVGGLILDPIKAPFFLIGTVEETIRAGFNKLLASVHKNKADNNSLIEPLFQSFLLRFKETATLLVILGVETGEDLQQKIEKGEIEELVGLTLLHTAYRSRHFEQGIVLASDQTLTRNHCPEIGKNLFDKIILLKKAINNALKLAHGDSLQFATESQKEEADAELVCQWLPLIKQNKLLNQADKLDATEAQIKAVNLIIGNLAEVRSKGMEILPEQNRVTPIRHIKM